MQVGAGACSCEQHLKTRASARNEEQNSGARMRRGAFSMHCWSSPAYSIQVGLVGKLCLPLGSTAPNANAPTPLLLCRACHTSAAKSALDCHAAGKLCACLNAAVNKICHPGRLWQAAALPVVHHPCCNNPWPLPLSTFHPSKHSHFPNATNGLTHLRANGGYAIQFLRPELWIQKLIFGWQQQDGGL